MFHWEPVKSTDQLRNFKLIFIWYLHMINSDCIWYIISIFIQLRNLYSCIHIIFAYKKVKSSQSDCHIVLCKLKFCGRFSIWRFKLLNQTKNTKLLILLNLFYHSVSAKWTQPMSKIKNRSRVTLTLNNESSSTNS